VDFEKERHWWNRHAASFDSIYSARKNPLSAALDRIFRWDMEARIAYALEKIAPAPGMHILDVACGTGRFSLPCARRGAQVTGVDISENMLTLAEKMASEEILSGCRFVRGDFMTVSPEELGEDFHGVAALGLFDYLEDPLPFLRKMIALSQGPVVASFPRQGTLRARIRSLRLRLLGCPVFFYQESDLRNLAAQAGGTLEEIQRIGQLHCAVFQRNQACHNNHAERGSEHMGENV